MVLSLHDSFLRKIDAKESVTSLHLFYQYRNSNTEIDDFTYHVTHI